MLIKLCFITESKCSVLAGDSHSPVIISSVKVRALSNYIANGHGISYHGDMLVFKKSLRRNLIKCLSSVEWLFVCDTAYKIH